MITEVTTPGTDGHRVVKIRIPAGARNGTPLRLPNGMYLKVRLLVRRTVLHLLVAAVVLLGLITGSGGLSLLLAAAWALLLHCRRYIRSAQGVIANAWRKAGPPPKAGFRYYLREAGILYLIPTGISLACYVLLASYVSLFSGSLSIAQLISLQQFLERVSRFFTDNLQLNGLQVLGLLILSYLISSLLLAGQRPGKVRVGAARAPYRLVGLYSKYSGAISTGLATLAALSLFGMQLGAPSTDLRLRIKIHQEGYAEVAKVVEAKLSQQVTTMLYNKVTNSFPQNYRDALRQPTEIDATVIQLQAQANQARDNFGVDDSTVDQDVQNETSRMQQVQDLRPELTVDNPEQLTPPADITPNQIDAAKAAVAPTQPEPGVEIAQEGQRKIVLHVEKLLTEPLANMTKPVTDKIPILRPVLQAVIKAAADQSLQDRVERAYNRVLTKLLYNPPADIDATTRQEATTVVAQTNVSGPVNEAAPQATSLTNDLRDKAAALSADATRLTQQVDPVVTDLINHLDGTSLSRIEEASTRLRELGPSLSESQVQQLVSTMRNGDEVIRHNAAIVVGEVESDYVSPSLRAEAKGICGCH